MKTYDPNWRNCFPTHVVRLHFQQWRFKRSIDVEVGGNVLGMENLDAAVDVAYDSLPVDEYGEKVLALECGQDELTCVDEDRKGEDWLKPMVVGFEIIDVRRDDGTTLTKKRPKVAAECTAP